MLLCRLISVSFGYRKRLFHALSGRCECYFQHQTRLFGLFNEICMDDEVCTKTGLLSSATTRKLLSWVFISRRLSTENIYVMPFQGDARAILSAKQGFSTCLTGSSWTMKHARRRWRYRVQLHKSCCRVNSFYCRLSTENICFMPFQGDRRIFSAPNEAGRFFRRDLHGYEARGYGRV